VYKLILNGKSPNTAEKMQMLIQTTNFHKSDVYPVVMKVLLLLFYILFNLKCIFFIQEIDRTEYKGKGIKNIQFYFVADFQTNGVLTCQEYGGKLIVC